MTESDRAAALVELALSGLSPPCGAAVLAHAAAAWARAVSRSELPPDAVVTILTGAVCRALEAQDQAARAGEQPRPAP
jgi:hypothetical protein